MFSKEESKKMRQEFWIFFGKRYPRKWLLYNTKIKDFSLKFSFDTKKAQVSFDVSSNEPIYREYYFEKLLSLKKLMEEDISNAIVFEENYILNNGKSTSRCYVQLDDVSIHNKNHWPQVFDFFNNEMSKFEAFFLEYEDFIKS